jgi:Flp pilus assembly protein TadG
MMISMLRRRLRRLRDQGERGSILILVVLSALIIVGSAGLAVDVGRLYATKAELSRSVDAAALAGVLEFDGTNTGLSNASTKACAYLQANEPTASCSGIVPDGTSSTLRIQASKSVRMYFLPIFGINSSVVSAKAISGFNDQTLDAVMVIDATYSMSGAPITNAKAAAIKFKDTLLGTSPAGNVVVGVAPLRGCYRPTPMPSTSATTDCIDINTQVQQLTSNTGVLDSKINALTPGGNSATNVCTGLGKGYQVLNNATYNHQTAPNNRRFMVLLSDGDNVYFGDYVYQASPASPDTFTVGAGNYACQPPNTCTGWVTASSSPCHNGTYTASPVTIASDDFNTNSWTGGTGWAGNWIATGTANTTSMNTPQGADHARVASTGRIDRIVDLSTVSGATLGYVFKKGGSWVTADRAYAEASLDGSTWTTLATYTNSISTSYGTAASITLGAQFIGQSSVHIRFRASTASSTAYLYVDTITIQDPNTTSNGYLNGKDGQDYLSCSEVPKPRERQVDVETLNIANAIKAQSVEIFVVTFSACGNTDGTTVYGTACASQANPVASPPASGKVGDTTSEVTANFRLAKCIASSTSGTNDHWYYATDVTQLPNIFTTIAAQIAHRLVE